MKDETVGKFWATFLTLWVTLGIALSLLVARYLDEFWKFFFSFRGIIAFVLSVALYNLAGFVLYQVAKKNQGRFWAVFFTAFAAACVALCWYAPDYGWWFPNGNAPAKSTIGLQIDDLFHLILIIVAVTFIAVNVALGYILWKGAEASESPQGKKALFTHGSHTLEVIWTIVPSGILLFIALYQIDVWEQFRFKSRAPQKMDIIAEVTARQFEWRIRYPARGKKLMPTPQPDDIYTVNDLRVPTGIPVGISLRSDDVQHSFFIPQLRVKQDAVPKLVIPVWFEVIEPGEYDLLCAELCGWGHYKMKARVVATSETEFEAWRVKASEDQFFDGVSPEPAEEVAQQAE